MKKLFYCRLMFIMSFAFLFQACQEPDGLTKDDPKKGELRVSFTTAARPDSRIREADVPTWVIMSVKDAAGNYVLNSEKLALTKVGSGYFTRNVEFNEGAYTVVDFIVLGTADTAIYLTPKTGSEFEELVNNPLPVSFDVSANATSDVVLEVISASLGEANQFGYATFSFVLVDPFTDGLIAYYPFSNNAEDVKNGNNGTVSGAVPTMDKSNNVNSAYFFDGVDDKINIGDFLDAGASDFSLVFKVKVSEFRGPKIGTDGSGGWILSKGVTIYGTPRRAGYAVRARKHNGENYFQFYVGNQNEEVFVVEDFGYLENEWYTIACTKNDNSIKLYVNGQLKKETLIAANSNLNTNIPLVFGAMDKLGNDPEGIEYFYGAIDEIKIFEKELTPTHVNLMR